MSNREATPHELEAEARVALDGGLDSRSGIFGKPGRATSLFNMNFQQTGHLTVRKGGSRVARVTALAAAGDLLGFTLVDTHGAGTIADATYSVKYGIKTRAHTNLVMSGAQNVVCNSGGVSAIDVHIEAVDSGEGVGAVDFGGSANTQGADLPQSCGYLMATDPSDPNAPQVYAKTGADGYTKQTIASITYVIPGTGRPYYRCRVTAYTNNGAADPLTNGYVSMRSLASHPDLDALFGWVGERAVYLHGPAVATPQHFGGGIDRLGNPYLFSRWPSKVMMVVLDKVAWAFDGIGKPKRLHWTGTPSSSKWLVGGANYPDAPTVTDTAVAGGPAAGGYDYAIAFIFGYKDADGVVHTVESEPSAVVAHTAAGFKVQVAWTASLETSPVNPDGTSSSVAMVRIYRTLAGAGSGTQLYKLADVKDGVGSPYIDDGTVTPNITITPTNSLGKIGAETPPPKLYYPCVHDGRIFASPQQWDINATTLEILRLRGGAKVRFSAIDTSGVNPNVWPSDYEVDCGSGRISGIVSFRGTLYIFKDDSIGVIDGSDPNSYGYREIFAGLGALPHSIVAVGTNIFFWDNAAGPCVLSGSAAQPIATDEIQVYWQSAKATKPYFRDAFYDRTTNEIRWVAGSMQNGPSSWIVEPLVEEYVLYTPSLGASPAFTVYRAGAAPLAGDSARRITGMSMAIGTSLNVDPAARNVSPFYCDTYGNYCQDGLLGYDVSPTSNGEQYNIEYVAQFPFFFGTDPEMVKLERHLCAIFELGGVLDTIQFAAHFLGKAATFLAPAAWGPVYGTLPLVGIDQWKRLDLDPATFSNLEQRGIKVQVSGVSRAGPVRLKLLSQRYRNVSNIRNV